jgi:hypothetical protein
MRLNLVCVALALGACSRPAEEPPPLHPNAFDDQLQSLSEPARNLGLRNAIRDSGAKCERVDRSVRQQDYKNRRCGSRIAATPGISRYSSLLRDIHRSFAAKIWANAHPPASRLSRPGANHDPTHWSPCRRLRASWCRQWRCSHSGGRDRHLLTSTWPYRRRDTGPSFHAFGSCSNNHRRRSRSSVARSATHFC